MASNENDLFGAVAAGNLGQFLGAGTLGAILGSFAIIIAALIKRRSPMSELVDARIRTLIEGYGKRINDLQREIEKLESKVDILTKALDEAHKSREADAPPYGSGTKTSMLETNDPGDGRSRVDQYRRHAPDFSSGEIDDPPF